MKMTKWIVAALAACAAVLLTAGCKNEPGIVYDADEWFIENATAKRYLGSAAEAEIPAGVTCVGKRAFEGRTDITSVKIPGSVIIIEDDAFSGCASLADVTIPASVRSIGWGAFSGCASLAGVAIPECVKSIGRNAFYECGKLTDVTIPGSVTSIGNYAFSECSSLESVTIPGSVESIGDSAFYGCNNVTKVTYQGTLEQWCALDGVHDLMYAENVTVDGKDLKSMTELVIPDGVTSIGGYAFSGCSSLESVQYGGTKEEWGEIERGSSIFSKVTDITDKDGVTFTVDRDGEITAE